MSNLKHLIDTRLGGDEGCVLELFQTDEVLDALIAQESPSDWYHFRKKTFDGAYLVRSEFGYEVYDQERGQTSNYRFFSSLKEAAKHFLLENGFKVQCAP